MTLHQLQYFAEIVRQRSFTRAARQLHISQPALSKSVRLLEQEFEAEFIDRNAKDFALTDSGALFYEYAQKLLAFTEDVYKRQSLICMVMAVYTGHKMISGNKKTKRVKQAEAVDIL